MENLAERIADKNKTQLHPAFVSALHTIAMVNGLHVNYVWEKWQEYSKQSNLWEQSATLPEFCRWNKWPEVDTI